MREPYELTAEQREIQAVCREFAAREIRPISAAVDEADTETPMEVWNKAAELGLTSFMLPEEVGGAGMTDALTACVVQEELCHGCSGIGNLITSGGFFAAPLVELGSEAQQQRWLRPLAGQHPPLTALCTTEPEAGSDAASIRTTAVYDEKTDTFLVNGSKHWISNGGFAEFFTVFPSAAAAATS